MREITKGQISAIYGILAKHGLRDDKERIVLEISGGRTPRVSKLTFSEALGWISSMTKNGSPSDKDNKEKMVRHIIAMAHEMNWIRRDVKVGPDGQIKEFNNYSDLHAWVNKYGYLKKALNKYTYEELPTLVTAFKNVYISFLKSHK